MLTRNPETEAPQSAGRSAADPVTFSNTVGLFMPTQVAAPRKLAVLFLSPWGLEEMCVRKFWRVLAEELSDHGIASLRFDYPGTGDALDLDDASGGLAIWDAAIAEAAAQLRSLSGCENLIVICQGLGALLLGRVQAAIRPLSGAVLLAPVISGRGYLRELKAFARMIDGAHGVAAAPADVVRIAGLELPAAIAEDVRKGELKVPPAPLCLIGTRCDRPADSDFARALTACGADVQELPFRGYDVLVSNPASSKIPQTVVAGIIEWIEHHFPSGEPQAAVASTRPPVSAEPLVGQNFTETPLTFGTDGRLYGILCRPQGAMKGAAVLLLGTAYDRQAGWARATVTMARDLAQAGIASLRFDCANVADSPPRPGFEGQVLYDDCQITDVREAAALLESRVDAPIIAAGRCSGAYLAFRSALEEPRLAGVVAVNPFTFAWRKGLDVDKAISTVPRSLGAYRSRALDVRTLRRLVSGKVDLRAAGTNILRVGGRRIIERFPVVQNSIPSMAKARRIVRRAFDMLAARHTRLLLLYSEGDVGLDSFARNFGRAGEGLKAYPLVDHAIVPGADHNFTPPAARAAYTEAVKRMAIELGSGGT